MPDGSFSKNRKLLGFPSSAALSVRDSSAFPRETLQFFYALLERGEAGPDYYWATGHFHYDIGSPNNLRSGRSILLWRPTSLY